jgi:hypothetical protein
MSFALFLAGLHNLAWGTWTCLFAADSFYESWGETPEDRITYRVWQGVGMLVAVYGIGYVIAARDPVRHWPIVFLGLLMKVFGIVGVVYSIGSYDISPRAMRMTYLNDVLWFLPFGLILRHAYLENQPVTPSSPPGS